jgi:hypothetical protein
VNAVSQLIILSKFNSHSVSFSLSPQKKSIAFFMIFEIKRESANNPPMPLAIIAWRTFPVEY